MIKPDGVRKNLIGPVLDRLSKCGHITTLRMGFLTTEGAKELYKEHAGKDFYDSLVEFIVSGKVVLIRLEGKDVVSKVRAELGAANSAKAKPGTIRAMYGNKELIRENVVHASDSPESAKRELAIFFTDEQ